MANWDRRDNESAKAYAAFCEYRNMGVERSLNAVSQNLAKSLPFIKEWSSKHEWVKRAEEWDAHQEEKSRRSMEKARLEIENQWRDRQEQLRQQEWDYAQKLIEKAKAMLDFPLAQKQTKPDANGNVTIVNPARWGFSDAARILDTASKLARLAADMNTSKSAVDMTWRSKAIEDIKAGAIDYKTLADVDSSLADELFKLAGVPIE